MSLTALAKEILVAAKAIDESLPKPSEESESHIKSRTEQKADLSVKPSIFKRLSKRTHRLTQSLTRCLPLRRYRSSPPVVGKDAQDLTSTLSTNLSENGGLYQRDDFERYDQLPVHLDPVRDSLINNCHRLRTLIETPETALINIYTNWAELVSLQVISHFRIFEAVPENGSATYDEIATTVGIPKDLAVRFIRTSILNGIFAELTPDHVQHTPRSRWLLNRGSGLHDLIALNCYELAPAALRYPEAIEKYGSTGEPEQSPFSLGNNNMPMFQALAQDPNRRQRFDHSMQYLTSSDSYDLRHILDGYNWLGIDNPGTRVLDVGGGLGQVSKFIASHTKYLEFTVQDLPVVVADALADESTRTASDSHRRISFLAHSFFVPHPPTTLPYDAVFLRWILHNWSDKYVRQIFRALIPALRKGSRVFLIEFLLDEKCIGVDASRSFGLRSDMMMGVGFSAKERTAHSIQILMDEVAEECGGKWYGWEVRRPECSTLSFMEVTWGGS